MRDLLAIFERLLAAFTGHSPEGVAACYSQGQATYLPGGEVARGREGKAQLLKGFFRAFPDLRIELDRVLVSDNNIVCVGSMKGTHTGPMVTSEGELPATGRHVDLPIAYVLTVGEDGLIETDRTYYDNGVFAGQLGLG
jgi:predicted ester cyclase